MHAHVVLPSHRSAVGRCSRARASNGSTDADSQRVVAAIGRVRRTTSPMKASVPSEPTIRRARSYPLTFFTVGPPAFTIAPGRGDRLHLEHGVAHGPVAEPAHPAPAHGQHPTDGRPGPGGQGDGLPVLGQRRVEVGHGRAGAHPHGHLGRLEGHDAGRRPHLPRAAAARAPPTYHWVRPPTQVTGPADSSAHLGRERARAAPFRSTAPPGRPGGRRSAIRRAAPSRGWPRGRGRRRRGGGPARRGRRVRTAGA